MKRLLCVTLFVAALFAFPVAGSAATIPLTGPIIAAYSQQDSPCFIGYSCGQNSGLPMTDYSGLNEDVQDSPLYLGADLTTLVTMVGLTPLIALDINQTGGGTVAPYQLNYVKAFVQTAGGLDTYEFGGPVLLGQPAVGNGTSDYVFSGLDLSGATSVYFQVSYGNFNNVGNHPVDLGDNIDGQEIFFLVAGETPAIPEPASMLLLGSGLVGLTTFLRRRR